MVPALVLAPLQDLDTARPARHSLTAGRRWSQDVCPAWRQTCSFENALEQLRPVGRQRKHPAKAVAGRSSRRYGLWDGLFPIPGDEFVETRSRVVGNAGKTSAKSRNRRTPPSQAGSERRTAGDDRHLDLRRKSQIFELDPASRPVVICASTTVFRPPYYLGRTQSMREKKTWHAM